MVILMLQMEVPEELEADVRDTVNALIGPTRGQPGCTRCGYYRSDDSSLLLVQEWRSRGHFRQYARSRDFRTLMALVELSGSPPDFALHTVSNSGGLDWIAQLQEETE